MKEAAFLVLRTLLRKENYRINEEELELQLQSHPTYPSLHSFTGVLDHFQIDNIALEVPVNKETLMQLPKSFITGTKTGDGLMVATISDEYVDLSAGNKKRKRVSIDAVLEQWSGIMLAIDTEDETITYKNKARRYFGYTLYATTALLLVGAFFAFQPKILPLALFLLSIGGLFISYLIVKHELGFRSRVVEKICGATETTDCNAVISSKAGFIFKFLKFSDASLIYFSAVTLGWIAVSAFQLGTSIPVLLTFLSIPVTLYSLYYQSVIVKQWCPLCLGIIGVLWLQLAAILGAGISFTNLNFNLNETYLIILCFTISASLWLFIKPLLEKEQELKKLRIDHYKFKRNFGLFEAAWNRSDRRIHLNRELESQEIILGNPNASLEVLLITSPQCFYCKQAHLDMENIHQSRGEDVKINIRFNVNTEDKANEAYQVSERLLELFHNGSDKELAEAMHEAYAEDVDLNNWLSTWGKADSRIYGQVLEKQKQWCLDQSLNFTPALYINGVEFPREYDRSDLLFFIDDLIETMEEKDLAPQETVP